MLDGLKELIDWMSKFVPRLEVVSTKEAGVAWWFGRPRLVRPGHLYPYWPLWTEVEWIALRPKPLHLPAQTIYSGRQAIVVQAVVVWRVRDVMKAICSEDDVESVIEAEALSAVRNATYGRSLAAISDKEEELEDRMRKDLQSSMRNRGVGIASVYFKSIAPVKAYVHHGGDGMVFEEEE